jgi:hypothetical protein
LLLFPPLLLFDSLGIIINLGLGVYSVKKVVK